LLDARLPDGSRVAAAFPPCSIHGVTLTVRKFRPHWFTLDELVQANALPGAIAAQLADAVRNRQTILVSGGTDTGKTTFTKALLDFIPQSERIGVIEDTMELKIDHPNVFRFEARKEFRDPSGRVSTAAVTIRDLVKATLRHRPDRLIIGEVRGGEAFDLLDALNTGHAGSISTLHANSATQALSRLASLALRADVDIPYRAIQAEIGDLISLVVHIERRDAQRFLSHVLRIEGFDAETACYKTTTLYQS
jgi:pilus assembly protein CpaF